MNTNDITKTDDTPINTDDTSISTDDDTKKAAEQGDVTAQFNLGNMYARRAYMGEGAPKDFTEAAKWYRKAAEQGHAEAQRVLGRMYAEGDGVPEDYVEAYMWFNIAAAHGNEYTAKSFIDKLLPKMSQEQIAEAQAMTRKWIEDFEKRNKK